MYSLTPLVDPNTVHFGFYMLIPLGLFFTLLYYIVLYAGKRVSLLRQFLGCTIYFGIFMSYPFYKSFIEELPVPMNEKVIATKVDYSEKMGSGKYPSMNSHVMYQTPTGVVSYPMGNGIAWPDQIVVYYNPQK